LASSETNKVGNQEATYFIKYDNKDEKAYNYVTQNIESSEKENSEGVEILSTSINEKSVQTKLYKNGLMYIRVDDSSEFFVYKAGVNVEVNESIQTTLNLVHVNPNVIVKVVAKADSSLEHFVVSEDANSTAITTLENSKSYVNENNTVQLKSSLTSNSTEITLIAQTDLDANQIHRLSRENRDSIVSTTLGNSSTTLSLEGIVTVSSPVTCNSKYSVIANTDTDGKIRTRFE